MFLTPGLVPLFSLMRVYNEHHDRSQQEAYGKYAASALLGV